MDRTHSFGYWLRRRRKALDLTQAELAQRANCSLELIRKIEADARRPSRQLAELLAECLGIDASERAAFIQAARAERPVDELALPAQPVEQPVAALPQGTVTFLFTDIEGSSRLWEQHPRVMPTALARHDALMNEVVTAHSGVVFKTVGDSMLAAFAQAPQALAAALGAQRAVEAELWELPAPPQVRMALHTGSAETRAGDYFGPALNRAARLLAAGHAGQVVLSLATEELVREHLPPDVTLRDLGTHRLKDLSLPERIFQLVAPDLPTAFPQLNTLDARRTNLPAQPTALIGREREVGAACTLLRRADARLVTLTGPGGIGKTRLGLQVAAELVEDFMHGVYFVDLAPIGDPHLVTGAIASTLGVREMAGWGLLQSLKDYLRDKRILLLLDNFEHVLEAAPLIAELLAAAAPLKLLATSREALHLRGEKEVVVQPLTLPPHPPSPSPTAEGRGVGSPPLPVWERGPGGEGDLTQYAAVALFIERAVDAQFDFHVTNTNAPAVAEICARLDGLPLAIELAAARIKLFAPEALLARLSNRLALLTGGPRDLPARQQTLRNTIGWSYRLLSQEQQALFASLGVFVGGWTLETAESVCKAAADLSIEILDGLQVLVDHSLLRHEARSASTARFSMLETIREYAVEQFEASGVAALVRQQHAVYYLALAEVAEPWLRTADQRRWLDLLEAELGNIRAALQWFIAGGEVAAALRLGGALWQFWAMRGHVNEGRERLMQLLALAERAAESHGGALAEPQAKARFATGVLSLIQGDFTATESLFQESVALFRTTQDRWGLACALGYLGLFEVFKSNTGANSCEESAALFEELGDPWGRAFALACRGVAAAGQGNPAARTFGTDGVRMLRELGDRWNAARLLLQLWDAAQWQEQAGWSVTFLEQSLALFREIGDTAGIADSLHNLGKIARWQGDYGRAAAIYDECLALVRELGLKPILAGTLHARGMVAYYQGDDQQARALLAQSLALFQETGQPYAIGWCLQGLAGVAARAGPAGARRAARLLAADDHINNPLQYFGPDSRREWEGIAAAARAQLDEATWASAWAEGHALTLEQAIAEALDQTTKPTDAPHRGG
jgi:predicted ATPase/class 3 adenylate cyclase